MNIENSKTNEPHKFRLTQREKCPNRELFMVRISCIRTEYRDLRSKYWKIRTRNSSEFGLFSRSVTLADKRNLKEPNTTMTLANSIFITLGKLLNLDITTKLLKFLLYESYSIWNIQDYFCTLLNTWNYSK